MEDDWAKETSSYIKIAKDLKNIVIDICNDRCSTASREFIAFGNDKKTNFSTREENEDLDRIHKKLEDSINKEVQLIHKNMSKVDEENAKKIVTESFSPFRPLSFYHTYYKKTPLKKDTLESKFYQNLDYREPFQFKVRRVPTEEVELKEGDIVSEDVFMASFTDFIIPYAIKKTAPKPIVLSGEIGSGKTTAFGKIIYALMEQNTKDSKAYLHPMIVDFETLFDFSERSKADHIQASKQVLKNLDKKIKAQVSKARAKGGKNKQIKPIVFLDNMDIIFQKFSEDYFLSPSGVKISSLFLNLISKYDTLEEKPLLVCGMREESLNAVRSNTSRRIGNSANDEEESISYIIEIKEKDGKEIGEIILKRLQLIYDVLSTADTHKGILITLKKNIEIFTSTHQDKDSSLKRSNDYIDFEEINNISAEGLRNTIDLFMRVSPTSQHTVLFNRFFIDPFYIKKLHFLGDSTAYTQGGNGIFNIFLNNTEYRLNKNYYNHLNPNLGEESIEKAISLAELSSLQTYWAKYFILVYLYQDSINKNIATKNIKDLVNIFSLHTTTDRYEENLVRLLLLGLSESRHGKILNIILNDSQEDIDRLQLSDKGKYILENTIWTFDYLAVIVEDFWLEIPDFILRDHPILQDHVTSYCFLPNVDEFNKKRAENLSIKIKKIKLFLDLLEISYTVEKVRVKRIFNILENQRIASQKFTLPNFKKIRKNLATTIKNYSDITGLKINSELDITQYSLSLKERRKLKTFFKKNYGTHISFDKDSIREYHSNNNQNVNEVLG